MLLAIALVLAMPSFALAGTAPTTQPRCGREDGAPKRCVGPVTDESGGGGDALTIVIGAVVGLTVAGVAFVLLRKQLSTGRKPR